MSGVRSGLGALRVSGNGGGTSRKRDRARLYTEAEHRAASCRPSYSALESQSWRLHLEGVKIEAVAGVADAGGGGERVAVVEEIVGDAGPERD